MSGTTRHLQASQFFGKGIESVFHEGSFERQPVPWKAATILKHYGDFDRSVVRDALVSPPQLEEIDPVDLHATQPGIVKGGVEHYLKDTYEKTGQTYEQSTSVGNRFPIVYRREAATQGYDPQPQNLILAGHHRATAALVQGKPLRAIVVGGSWGPPR